MRRRRFTGRSGTRWRSSARRPRRGLPVLLKGPTGCGKTRFVEAMAHELGRELITVAGHEDMTSADLVGRFLLKGGETVWVDGPLTRAVREGAIFYLDEIVEARQDTTVVIHPLADHRRELPVDRLGTTLKAAPGFQLVISYNPGYQSVLKNIKESTRQRSSPSNSASHPPISRPKWSPTKPGSISRLRAPWSSSATRSGTSRLAAARSVLDPDADPRRRPRRRRAEPAQCRPVGRRPGAHRRSRTSCARSANSSTRSCPNDRLRSGIARAVSGSSPPTSPAGPSTSPRHPPASRRTPTARSSSSRRASRRRAAPRDAGAERTAGRGQPGSAIGEDFAGTSGGGAPLPRARRSPGARRTGRTDSARRRASPDGTPSTATADESLEMAKGRSEVADPPDWFGVIKPSRLLVSPAGPGAQATDKDLRLEFDPRRHARGRRRR